MLCSIVCRCTEENFLLVLDASNIQEWQEHGRNIQTNLAFIQSNLTFMAVCLARTHSRLVSILNSVGLDVLNKVYDLHSYITCSPCGVKCAALLPLPEPGCASRLSACLTRLAVGVRTPAKRKAVAAGGSGKRPPTQGCGGLSMYLHERSLVAGVDHMAAWQRREQSPEQAWCA